MRVLALALLTAAAASAQPSNWELPTSGAIISLDAERPLFKDGAVGELDFGPTTSAWAFGVAYPIGPSVRVVGELPFAFASVDAFGESVDGSALGNAQIGAELDLPLLPVGFGGYVRIPTTSSSDNGDLAQFIGTYGDVEQIGAFIEDIATVSIMAEATPSLASLPGVTFRLRATPIFAIPVGDDDGFNDDVEVFASYAAQAFFSSGVARFGGGVSGITFISEDIDDRHQVSVGAIADVGLSSLFRIGADVRVPITGSVADDLSSVVGLRLVYGGL